jgi:murein DD-endopeptidase MepM/ murein hydrolase activator NlpD
MPYKHENNFRERRELKGVPLGEVFGSNSNWGQPSESIKTSGWLQQTIISLALLLLLTAIFFIDTPVTVAIQNKVRYYLADRQSDLSPVLRTALGEGIWRDNNERQVIDLTPPEKPVIKSLPVMSIPVSGRFVREFGWESLAVEGQRRLYPGIVIATDPGAPVRASLPGRAVMVGQTPTLGRLVELEHAAGLSTVYAGLSEILVSKGQQVSQDEIIGKAGITNNQAGLIHFEVRVNGTPVNPVDYFRANGGRI